MKKKILILLILLCVCFIPKAYAGQFNFLRINTVFDGSGVPTNLEKIYLYYTTVTDGVEKKESVVLTRTYNFTTKLPVLAIDDVKFRYAIAMTKNNVLDVYGFVIFTSKIEKDERDEAIDLTVVGKLDNRGFDGEKYRGNSDLTDEDIENLKKGNTSTTGVVDPGTNPTGVITTTSTTTTTTTETTTKTKVTGTEYIHDSRVKTKEQKQQELEESGYLLLIVLGVILVIVLIVVIVVIVKMLKANRRV